MADTRRGRRMLAAVRHLADRLRPPVDGTDAELLARFAAGDEAAFTDLLRRHGPMVFGVCRRLTRSHHDAEDAFQAAFLVLAARPGAVRPPERLGAWLHGVAVNVARKARDHSRRAGGVSPPCLGVSDAVFTELVATGDSRPPLAPDEVAALHAEVLRLPDRYRLPVVLCHLEGQSRRDAAAALGWPEGTVSGRLARGLKLLGDRLRRRGVGLPAVALTAVVPAELLASTSRSAVLVAAGLAPVPAYLLPLTRGVFPMPPLRTVTLLLAGFGLGAAGLVARPAADPPPAPVHAARPAPQWVELAKATRPAPITRLAFGPAGVAAADADGFLVHWKADFRGEPDLVLKGGTEEGKTRSVDRLRFDTAGRWLYGIANGGRALWRFKADDMSGGHGISGEDAVFHDSAPSGLWFVERYSWVPREVRLSPNLWKGEPAAEARAVGGKDVAFDAEVGRCVLSAGDSWLAVALANGTVQMVARDGMTKGTILPVTGGPAGELAFSPDGNRLAVVEPGGAVTLFAHSTGVKLATLAGHAGGTVAVAWHPDGNVLATAGADKAIRLWDAATGKPGQVLTGHADAVTGVAFSPDGKRLASGSADKTARVWEFRR